MEKIQQYRQPMVTATGIFLGFMPDFANSWMPVSFTQYKIRDAIIAASTLSSIAVMIIVLYRILQMSAPVDPLTFYKKTLRLFIIGISIPFFSMVVIMLRRLFLYLG